MTAVKEKAYAKINLFLDVLSKREDGFHDIRTVMHTVSLCDDVTVFYTPRDKTSIRISVDGNRYLPQDSRNLAYRAAELYLKKTAITASVEIKLIKRIPVAAGLAGGSADAAAVLRALNRINHKRLTDKALSELAGELGSDIPYCLFGKSALCEGRGENITRLPNAFLGHFVVAVGNEHVSTPKAYGALDVTFSDFDGSIPTGGNGQKTPQGRKRGRKGAKRAAKSVSDQKLTPRFSNSIARISSNRYAPAVSGKNLPGRPAAPGRRMPRAFAASASIPPPPRS